MSPDHTKFAFPSRHFQEVDLLLTVKFIGSKEILGKLRKQISVSNKSTLDVIVMCRIQVEVSRGYENVAATVRVETRQANEITATIILGGYIIATM